jgi:integrase
VLYDAIPETEMKLLVETDIESGLRWGELAELRVRDLNLRSRTLTVSRVVVEPTIRFRVNGPGSRSVPVLLNSGSPSSLRGIGVAPPLEG